MGVLTVALVELGGSQPRELVRADVRLDGLFGRAVGGRPWSGHRPQRHGQRQHGAGSAQPPGGAVGWSTGDGHGWSLDGVGVRPGVGRSSRLAGRG